MSNVDPGGGDDGDRLQHSEADLSSLQENFSQQQTKISALKELVRQSEADQGRSTASAKEKVKNIAQRLNHLKSKTARGRHSEKSFSEIEEEFVGESQTSASTINLSSDDPDRGQLDRRLSSSMMSVPTTPLPARARSETPGSEKIQLLRQQMEQNRMKMAERENNKRGIEQLVTQLKAKFDSSQLSLDKAHQLGRSVGDLSNLPSGGHISSKHQSTGDLSGGFNLERERIKYLEKRVRQLEAEVKAKDRDFFNKDPESEHLKMIKVLEEKIIDLEENLKEKDDVIEARTQAASLISESLSLKGKSTVDMLEDTKQEMMRMQTNFVAAEDDLRAEIERIARECDQKDKKIANLEEVNDILETARFDLTVKNSELDNQSSNVEDYIQKVNELNKVNEALQRRIESLESNQNDQDDGQSNQAMVEQALKIQELENTIKELQAENSGLKESLQSALNAPVTNEDQLERIQVLEAELAIKKEDCQRYSESLEDVQEQLMEKTVEFNVLVANFNVLQEKLKSSVSKSLFSRPTDEEAHAEIRKLKIQLDTLTSASDANKTLLEKQEEIDDLRERIVQLESDKAAIMEASKMELQNRVKDNKSKEEVTSQLESIALEEKVEIGLKEAAALKQQIHQLTAEKNDLKSKLDRYMTENMDLLNKIEKLSKGSSAESIEIVEGLTAEEKLEMEQFQKGLEMRQKRQRMQGSITEDEDADFMPTVPVAPVLGSGAAPAGSSGNTTGNTDTSNKNDDANRVTIKELNDSLDKLSDERTELLKKIDIFAGERHEVLEKLEVLKVENSKLESIIDELRVDKLAAEQSCESMRRENLSWAKRLREAEEERQDLMENLKEIGDIKCRLQEEINTLTRERNTVLENVATSTQIPNRAAYDSGLQNLVAELESYRKAKDKNVKFGISKRVVKEAKTLADLVPQLLEEYERSVDSYISLRAEVEGTQQAREEFERIRLELMAEGCTKDLTVYVKTLKEKFEAQLKSQREARDRCEELEQLLEDERRENDDLKRSSNENTIAESDESTLTSTLKDENHRLNEKVKALEAQLVDTKEYTFNELQKQRKEFENRLTTSQEEISILQSLVAEQKQQLIAAYTEHEDEFQAKVKQITELGLLVQKLRAELEQTEQQMSKANNAYADSLKEKVDEMKSLLDENNELLSSQAADLANKQETIETLNQQIMDLYAAMEQQGSELNSREDEINKLQDTIDEHLREIRTLKERGQTFEKRIKDAEVRLSEKETEIEKVRTELETKNKEQLEKLKKFAANLKKKNAQYSDLELKYKELEAMKETRIDGENSKDNAVSEQLLEEQKQEIQRLQQQVNELHLDSRKESVALQQNAPSPNNQHLGEINELKESLAHLEDIIESKNAEIAAQQQKVLHTYAELENIKLRLSEKVLLVDQFTSETQSKSAEIVELRESLIKFNDLKVQLEETEADLKSKNIKIEKCKAIIKEKNREIKRLREQVQTLTDQQLPLADFSSDSVNTEVERLKQEKQDIATEYECYRSGAEAKSQEAALFIETLENENSQMKDRIGRLEESICVTEERRSSLERHAELLGSELKQKESQIEHAEDEYMDRLHAIVGQDEIIEQKLKDLEAERDGLADSLKELRENFAETSRQNSLLQSYVAELESVKLVELESENRSLCGKIEKLESEMQRQNAEYERTLEIKMAEFADLENELSNHLKEMEKERRAQQEVLEKCRDDNANLRNEIGRLHESKAQLEQSQTELTGQMSWYQIQAESMSQDQLETQELRMQVVQDQTEVENLRTQNQEMARDHEAALNGIRQQLADVQAAYDAIFATHQSEVLQLESLRAQFQALESAHAAAQCERDQLVVAKDQVVNEMDTLKSQICHDQTDLVNLRLQNQQLINDHENELATLRLRISELNASHAQAEQEHLEVQNLRLQIGNDQAEIESLRSQKQQLDNELAALRQQVTALDSMQMHVGQNITQDQLEVQQLRTQVGHDQTEIEALRAQMQQLTAAHDSELAALRQQIAELDSLRMQVGQNQTDDQVFIQNENERLQAVLAEKELEIQNYQRQNLQLQMSAGSTAAAPFDPFAAISVNTMSAESTDSTTAMTNRITELESQLETALNDLADKQNRIQSLELALGAYTSEDGRNSRVDCLDMQRLVCEKDVEIARLQDIHQHLLSSLPVEQDHSATFEAGHGLAATRQIQLVSSEPIHNINFLEVTATAPGDVAFPSPSIQTSASQPNVEHHDQQIEDLQRNVSDLEKYVTDLEHKLKSSTEENLKCTNERYILENNFASKSNQYEERIAQLEQQIVALEEELAVLRAERQLVQSPTEVITANKPNTKSQSIKTASIFFTSSADAQDDPFRAVVGGDGACNQPSQAVDAVDADGRIPVVEETIVPKKAYLCHPTEDAERQTFSPVSDAWGESGWGGDEAALEEEHQRLSYVDNQSRGLNSAEVKLQLQIDELSTERNNLSTELTAMQAKYARMLKKLREYKTKNDEYEHSKRAASIETNDLDLAIQEELNAQIRALEQRIKDMKQEQEKEALEKKKLQSRIDVLTSANDRMTEMKEKQDIEVEVCKTKIRDLNNKLEQLNTWDDDESSGGQNIATGDNAAVRLAEALNQNRVLEERIARLQASISDKDEFEEERLQLTESVRNFQRERDSLVETVKRNESEIEKLRDQIRTLETQNHDYSTTIDVLSVESTNIKTYLDRLKDEHKQKIDENNNLSENLKSLDDRNLELSKQIEEMRVYNLNAQDVEQRIQDLTATVQYKDSEVANLNEQLESETKAYEETLQRLQSECQKNAAVIAELQTKCAELTTAKNDLETIVASAVAKSSNEPVAAESSSQDYLEKVVAELKSENAQMEQELQVLNDQVLKNLEIEDKIKATVLELDMKNIEISELKNSLDQLREQQKQQQSDALPSTASDKHDEQIRQLQTQLDQNESYHQTAIAQLNDQWQQSVEQKCSELAESWRTHLAERENSFAQIENELRQKLAELENHSAALGATEPQATSDANESAATQATSTEVHVNVNANSETKSPEMVDQMQKALEAQEMEIISLKEQLAMRSAQYARIAAQIDPYGEWSTLANSARKLTADAIDPESGDRTRELDHALYMLHQRDMRCEELKMEIINLLEERDGLQSKLANALRKIEDIKPQPR